MVGGGLSTRRRSSSAGAHAADSAASGAASSTSRPTRNQSSSAPSVKTRTARRGRGLPIARPSRDDDEDNEDENSVDPQSEETKDEIIQQDGPSAAATKKGNRASSPVSNPAPSMASARSPRASPRTASALAKKATLTAVIERGDKNAASKSSSRSTKASSNKNTASSITMQVTIKIGGRLFLPTEVPDSLFSPTLKQEGNSSSAGAGAGAGAVGTRRRSRSTASVKEESAGTNESTAAGTVQPVDTTLPLGHDGNTFYCQTCGGVGDVVCCDGCPRVYHRDCVPKSKSRTSLEQDDDPWYCPQCFPTKSGKKASAASTPSSSRKKKTPKKIKEEAPPEEGVAAEENIKPATTLSDGVERTCFQCNEKGLDLKQCESCEGWIHFPSCHPDDDDFPEDEDEDDDDDDESPRKVKKVVDPNRILCRICRVEEMETGSQTSAASSPVKTRRQAEKYAKRNRGKKDDDDGDNDEEDDGDGDDVEDDEGNDPEDDVTSRGDQEEDGEDNDENDEDENEDDDSKAPSKSRKGDEDEMDVDDMSTNPDESPSSTPSTTKKTSSKKKISKTEGEVGASESSTAKSASSGGRKSPAPSSKREMRPTKKRSRPSLPSSKVKENLEQENDDPSPITPSQKKKSRDKKNNKKKKNEPSSGSKPAAESPTFRKEDDDVTSVASTMAHGTNPYGYPRAVPAFFFFLGENRLRIERHLARKHRIFNRLPKGFERNQLVAKEGAVWWSKLKESEIKRFMEMSMADFEQRIIEWKEEKNIRDMMIDDTSNNVEEDDQTEISLDDEILTYENHQRLYLGTTVGSKPFKPEAGTSHNRILLELLQDMRFHPMPMFQANRSSKEYGEMDFDRITIPYFDVHGPFSTSVGDECLGCTRGWAHYCNVLKRRIPAIEHRAKLQPPLSSLMSTRIGLGLKPSTLDATMEPETEESAKNLPLFAVRDVPHTASARRLPQVACETLNDSSSRADDVVQFIEETIAMKVPEPSRPDFPGRFNPDGSVKMKGIGRGTLPLTRTVGQKRAYDTLGGHSDRNVNLNKCGRCRTVISTDTGCIQCRRAQLVINLSRRPPPGGDVKESNGKSSKDKSAPNPSISQTGSDVVSGNLPGAPVKNNLKVHTVMLGRVMMKDGSGEVQHDADHAVANGILRQRWTPFTIMPPHTLSSPTPKSKMANRRTESRLEESAEEDATMDDVLTTNKRARNEVAEDSSGGADDASTSSPSHKEDAMDLDDDQSSTDPSTAANEDCPNEDGPVADGTRPASKRIRSARLAGDEATQTETLDDGDRQELAVRYKEEADELHKKCLGVACCGILLALMRRDPLLLFASPVTAEGYSLIIKNPMDFGKIRTNVLADKYGTLGSFVSDCRLLCTNALAYNPPGSIYWKTAKELYDVLAIMQRRVSNWMNAVKDAHAMAWRRAPRNAKTLSSKEGTPLVEGNDHVITTSSEKDIVVEDPFADLRKTWPEAVDMLEDSDWLRQCISADFMRTKENETAYYGALAVRRTAAAAEAALAAYPDSSGMYSPVSRRTHAEDEALRRAIEERATEIVDPVELKDWPSWREESIIRVMRRAQTRRLDGMCGSNNGCARCDESLLLDPEAKRAKTSQPPHLGPKKSRKFELPRIHPSRVKLSTGMASKVTRERIQNEVGEIYKRKELHERAKAANEVAVSVKGSGIHGWGLFADQNFKKGDVVAEYIGEYVSLAVTEAREKEYQEKRIQDYQFRLDDQLVIDATMRGGHGRYINHNCSPNCIAKIIPGNPPYKHLKRVIIMAQRDIEPREELTYDYQFPLELDLEARIPCNCMSEHCRGFMNWDLPEKGSNQNFRSQKRGANMRDRIRRLGRPLKSDRDGGGDDNATATSGADDDQSKN